VLIPVGWALYIAKLTDRASEESLDAIVRLALVATLGLALLPLARRAGLAWSAAFVGFAAVPAIAYAFGGPPGVAAFAYGALLVVCAWLLARRRPVVAEREGNPELAAILRGRGGLALIVGAGLLTGFVALAPLSAFTRVLITLVSLIAALAAVRMAEGPWRLIAGFFVALSFAMLVFEALLLYDFYPLAPVALLAAGGCVAAVPALFAATQGRIPPRKTPGPKREAASRNGAGTTADPYAAARSRAARWVSR
jgi:hypothetical protein